MMRNDWQSVVVLTALGAAIPGLVAAAPAMSAPEAAIRQADADWSEAAGTRSVDAWMTFYSADAVVLAPEQPIATDPALIRRAIADLLALPNLAISWHPVKVEVAAAGDLAYVIGAYDLRYDDPRTGHTRDRGKLLEVWRRQADGRWKCIVDTWNSDGALPASSAASPVATPAASENVRAEAQEAVDDYGAAPIDYESAVRRYFQQYLTNPESVRYREITPPRKSAIKALTGGVLVRQATLKGWTVNATLDAKNSHGVYVGDKTYSFLFRGEKIVHTTSPLTGDEMK